MADDPEDPGGETMTMLDLLSFSLPFLAGAIVILRSGMRTFTRDSFRRIEEKVIGFHRRANATLIRRRLLRAPGVHLVASLRGWLGAEVVFLGTLAFSWTRARGAVDIVVAVVPAALLGGLTLVLSVRDQARKQIDAARTSLPVASFLLSLLIEAGMSSAAAMPEVARALPQGPLAREFEEICRSHLLGVPRSDALERSRLRVPLEEYRLFLNIVGQSERLGIGLSQGLRELSSRMLESQGHRAETIAQRAAVKLLFPLVCFIFPSVFLVILSPVVLGLLGQAEVLR